MSATGDPVLEVRDLRKGFTLHMQGGVYFTVLNGLKFDVRPGECVALHGASGVGKSTVLRCLYGNYLIDAGSALLRHEGQLYDIAHANPRTMLMLRRQAIGYVSQFLRALPRLPALDIVSEPLRRAGMTEDQAAARARTLLERLKIPARLWAVPPSTFSGGEQQRVNIARGFAQERSLMLLDEPTAALDAVNREVVVELIGEAKSRGASIVGVFHDRDVREAVSDRIVLMTA